MAERNTPVLIGTVPLLYVQSLSITEGYQIERIAGSRFSQAIAPTTKTIAIEALLPGPGRLLVKKQLEALALVSRVLVAAAAPLLAVTGIPVVCGLTVSLDMQITDLRFTQSVNRRETLDASLTLRHVPRSSVTAALGEAADLALAAGTALSAGTPPAAPVPRVATAPLAG
ncbi:hypothetical protein [Bailinhaonella thermotolerans]|uniref:Uncharacterized protein n=1 Tax=Bailinhaonella thermotolerans TaxID=1070861 RepID=A0A3A4BV23_9ACTN|nr:hypothetical protein [Bailinhaonella thermotolerans]RJL35438.1 hypothetical protein D5H75_01080 [Bailinhaonella thermotolerans]